MGNIFVPFSAEVTRALFSISFTLLVAIVVDLVLRSFIKVPKSFENRRSRAYIALLRKMVTIVVYVTAIYFIFMYLGVNLTPLLASASIVGIVVGIGARALIEDLLTGFFLLSQDAIGVGDFVKVDDSEGTIEELGFRTLTIRGASGELHIIPNGQVKRVVNFSRHRSYMNVEFPVKSDQDIDVCLKAMREALAELRKDKEFSEAVHEESEVLGIQEFKTDGRMVVHAKIVTSSQKRFPVARAYRYFVKKRFEKYKVGMV
jgi:small conductance mechanosensitive channel